MKVSVFFDGQNFYRSLQRYDESLRVDYDRLAAWITQAAGGPGAIFAGAHYYVGVSSDAPPLVEGFLKGLELRPGYFVKRELRVRRSGRCPACSAEYEYTTEKRVDTRLVADIIQYAAIGAFDAAVLVSGDDDFVPAVEAVNALGKQVWVATWSADELSKDLRVRCFGQIHLSDGIPAFKVERPRSFERAPTRMAPSRLMRSSSTRNPSPRIHASPPTASRSERSTCATGSTRATPSTSASWGPSMLYAIRATELSGAPAGGGPAAPHPGFHQVAEKSADESTATASNATTPRRRGVTRGRR